MFNNGGMVFFVYRVEKTVDGSFFSEGYAYSKKVCIFAFCFGRSKT